MRERLAEVGQSLLIGVDARGLVRHQHQVGHRLVRELRSRVVEGEGAVDLVQPIGVDLLEGPRRRAVEDLAAGVKSPS